MPCYCLVVQPLPVPSFKPVPRRLCVPWIGNWAVAQHQAVARHRSSGSTTGPRLGVRQRLGNRVAARQHGAERVSTCSGSQRAAAHEAQGSGSRTDSGSAHGPGSAPVSSSARGLGSAPGSGSAQGIGSGQGSGSARSSGSATGPGLAQSPRPATEQQLGTDSSSAQGSGSATSGSSAAAACCRAAACC